MISSGPLVEQLGLQTRNQDFIHQLVLDEKEIKLLEYMKFQEKVWNNTRLASHQARKKITHGDTGELIKRFEEDRKN